MKGSQLRAEIKKLEADLPLFVRMPRARAALELCIAHLEAKLRGRVRRREHESQMAGLEALVGSALFPAAKRLYKRIAAAKCRCHNEEHRDYAGYGGRGIQMHEAWRRDWRKAMAYLMSLKGWDDPDLHMDRIDNDGDYEPGNIRFATPRVSRQNQRPKRSRKTK